MSNPVQFFGKEQVMQAAENMDCPAWAIFIMRDLFTKFEENDPVGSLKMLEQAIDTLMINQSEALHKLKFYEIPEGKDRIKINERTVCDAGSFTFKLVDPEVRQANQLGYIHSQANLISEKKIWNLEQQLKDKEAELKAREYPQSIGDIAKDYLQRPDELKQIIDIGRALLGFPVLNIPAGSIGAVRSGAAPQLTEQQEHDLDDLEGAIDMLQKHDPKIVAHLKKLAQLAEEKPDTFKGMISMLDLQ
jgi:hypothetical protein